jgi:hypothetical protein
MGSGGQGPIDDSEAEFPHAEDASMPQPTLKEALATALGEGQVLHKQGVNIDGGFDGIDPAGLVVAPSAGGEVCSISADEVSEPCKPS